MIQLLKYSDTFGPYFFMILVIAITTCAIWLIAQLKTSVSGKNDWFVKRNNEGLKKVMMN
ncbi:hypothetical protein [Dyadobacter sp. CY356]|uniref:hypothetical protein n=1 Tax=Dyadobacter sp. CY356 TaxID=2906442 RepID=UPI001F378A44|nr:hypothetical protein [Dyadobacter sp. CY356]MCF0055973.1 hypothetical protein [Dyadobacter sp. CY356]